MKEKIVQELIARLGHFILWLLVATLRFRVHPSSTDTKVAYSRTTEPHIYAFWHNRQMIMGHLYLRYGGKEISVLISQHRDGRLIARIMELMGVRSIAGSSTRGGTQALKAMVRVLRGGGNIAITPDGPKGPCYEAKAGTVQLASLSGAPICPMVYGAQRAWVFKSWDRMILPKPFSKVVLYIGEPMSVPKNLSAEQLEVQRALLEERLNTITTIVDTYEYP